MSKSQTEPQKLIHPVRSREGAQREPASRGADHRDIGTQLDLGI